MNTEENKSGFEKKTIFDGRPLDELAYATGAEVPTTPIAQHLYECHTYIDSLEQLTNREWIPIESVTDKQLDYAICGKYEFKDSDGRIVEAEKDKEGGYFYVTETFWLHNGCSMKKLFTHFRLIARADEFVAPEPVKPEFIIIDRERRAISLMTDWEKAEIIAAAELIKERASE